MTEFYSIHPEDAVHGDKDSIYRLMGMATTDGALRDVVEPVSAFYFERKLLRETEASASVGNSWKLD